MPTNERQGKEITQLKQSVIILEEHQQIIRKHMEKKENELLAAKASEVKLKAGMKQQGDMFLERQKKFNLT